MTYISMLPFFLITCLLMSVAFLMAFTVTRDFKVGLRFRDELSRRVRFLRLDKMLTKRNIKLNRYLHTERVSNIENQIRACESCSETEQCDLILKQKTPADLSFCPNSEGLELISINQKKSIRKKF